jgi:3-hydroxyacyl-[acyl-carrier-protein] dehydratase
VSAPRSGAASIQVSFVIDADHPALPGHFPGVPVVPGVMLLDRVIDAASDWLDGEVHVESIQQAKFLQPLAPGQTAHAILRFDGLHTLQFQIERAGVPIAKGVFGIRIGQQR